MPAALEYQRPDAGVNLALEESWRREIDARQKRAAMNWDYYLGNHRLPLRPDKTRLDDNIIINLIGLAIDKTVTGLLGTEDSGALKGVALEVQLPDGGPLRRSLSAMRRAVGAQEPDSPEQQYLDTVTRINQFAALLHEAMLYGALTGDAFLKIMPGGATDPDTGEALPRLIALNPANVSIFWDAEDRRRVLWYRVQYDMDDNAARRQDIVRLVNEDGSDAGGWLVLTMRRDAREQVWRVSDETFWPYDFAPILHWANLPNPRSAYGRDCIGQLGRMNDSYNFILSNAARIIKYHAHPRTIGTGFTAGDMQDTAVDGFWSIPAADARVFNLEMLGDLSSSLSLAQTIRRAAFDEARELDPASVADRLGAITNFGLRVLYADTLGKYSTMRLLADSALRSLGRRLLMLAGYAPHRVSVVWPDSLPNDPLQEAQALAIDRAHGLSRDTYLERRGYDAPHEEAARELERAEAASDAMATGGGALADRIRGMIGGGDASA